ncbi:MAG: hypothetical protein OXC98_01050 [bacterium]|nr:hypothetical protein [Acidimicrobiia bacterium]MCY4648944.1 hypothetical protein [bacterium]
MAELHCGEWRSGPVTVADSFWKRLAGIHGVPGQWGVLIPGRSVHGMFILARLWAVGLDGTLRVVGVRSLGPGGMVVFGDADAVLELRHSRVPPRVGWVLAWKDGLAPWPAC